MEVHDLQVGFIPEMQSCCPLPLPLSDATASLLINIHSTLPCLGSLLLIFIPRSISVPFSIFFSAPCFSLLILAIIMLFCSYFCHEITTCWKIGCVLYISGFSKPLILLLLNTHLLYWTEVKWNLDRH